MSTWANNARPALSTVHGNDKHLWAHSLHSQGDPCTILVYTPVTADAAFAQALLLAPKHRPGISIVDNVGLKSTAVMERRNVSSCINITFVR